MDDILLHSVYGSSKDFLAQFIEDNLYDPLMIIDLSYELG